MANYQKNNYNRNRNYKRNNNHSNNNNNHGSGGIIGIVAGVVIVITVVILLLTGVLNIEQVISIIEPGYTTKQSSTTYEQIITPIDDISADNYLKIYFIDVGQADSILIEEVNNTTKTYMLVDAGTSEGHTASVVVDFLKSKGVTELKYFILTHPHSDHIGAAKSVIDNFKIKNVFIPDCTYDTATWNKVLTALDAHEEINVEVVDGSYIGKVYKIVNSQFRILWPDKPNTVKKDDINDVSIVCKLVFGNNSIMLTGDAEVESEKGILSKFSKSDLKCDVLKAGHHGSRTSSSQDFLDAVRPSTVIISCGKDNSYGHPHEEALTRYQKMSCNVARTDLSGTLVLVFDGSKIYFVDN